MNSPRYKQQQVLLLSGRQYSSRQPLQSDRNSHAGNIIKPEMLVKNTLYSRWSQTSINYTKSANYNWYNCHLYVPQYIKLPTKKLFEVLILHFIFFQFYSVVSWDSKFDTVAIPLLFFFCCC